MVDIRVLTIFPSVMDSFLRFGNPARAIEADSLRVIPVDLRDFTQDKHHSTDDYPYGGGSGMIMKPEPVVRGIRKLRETAPGLRVVLLTPQGRTFDQETAEDFTQTPDLCLVCGRYEGFDERIRAFVDDEISIGDFILSGGETAAMVIIDAVSRLIPGVLGTDSRVYGESFYEGLLEFPQYTRPREFEGMRVPDILLEGHHAKIVRWRKKQALTRTLERRADLLKAPRSDEEERELLEEIQREMKHGEEQ